LSNSQTIPWKRLTAEAAAIVISILLAFWIDAWWDGRKDKLEEREILIGLEVEFVDLRDRLDQWAQFNRTGVKFIEQFLSDSVTDMNLRSIESAFTYASLVNILDQGGALDALLASGRLERISDRGIRVRLVKWPDWLEDIHTNDVSSRSYVMSEIVPYLAKHGFPQKVCPTPEWFFVCSESEPVPHTYLKLSEDPEFRSMLVMRRAWMLGAAHDHESARDEAEDMLVLLRERLADLGD
jgi:hypothetical protein